MWHGLSFIDFSLIGIYFAVILCLGYFVGKGDKDDDSFFIGSRRVPWFAVLCSLVATEVSAMTFLGTPGTGFSQNFNYLQFGIGSIFARIFIASVFLTAFYSKRYFSIYQYLGDRFGHKTKYTAVVYFILTRLMASGVRLLMACIGVSVILGVPLEWCLLVFMLVAMVYTSMGGIKAVIWTDVVQGIVFISAGLITVCFIINHIGWSEIISLGKASGRFEFIHTKPTEPGMMAWLKDSNLWFLAILNGFIGTAAAFGTDQDITQRVLTCKDVASAKKSMILSGFISIPIAGLFLFIGVSLFAYYQINTDPNLPVQPEAIFPYFIQNELPPGLKGIAVIGVFAAAMSSLDSAMAALSSSAINDLLKKVVSKSSDRSPLFVSRITILVFGSILALLALLLEDQKELFWLSFKMVSITYGAMLGIFVLGLMTKRGSDTGNLVAMISASTLVSVLMILLQNGKLSFGWTWLILIGAVWTFTVAYFWKVKIPVNVTKPEEI